MTNVALALTANLGPEPATRGASGLGYVAAGLILLAIACEAIYVRRIFQRREHGGGDPGDDDGGGGGGLRRGEDRIPPKGSPGNAPEWWPEFERQFADHVAAQSQVQSQVQSPVQEGLSSTFWSSTGLWVAVDCLPRAHAGGEPGRTAGASGCPGGAVTRARNTWNDQPW